MMARISCSRTSKLTSVKRLTPPKASEMSSNVEHDLAELARRSPCGSSALSAAALAAARRRTLRVADLQVGRARCRCGRPRTAPASRRTARLPRVQRVDEHRVLLGDEAAAHLARARELAVVGIELLVQHQEAVDLRAGELASGARSALTFSTHSRIELVRPPASPRGPCIPNKARSRRSAQLPTARMSMLMMAQTCRAPSPNATASLMYGKELELVLDVLGREQRAVGELADVLGASMIFSCPRASKKPASPVWNQPRHRSIPRSPLLVPIQLGDPERHDLVVFMNTLTGNGEGSKLRR